MAYNRRIILGLITAVLVTPTELQAVSPYDYKVPVSVARFLRVGGYLDYAGGGSDIWRNRGQISLAYERYYNSLPFAWDLEFAGSGRIRRTDRDGYAGSYSFSVSPGIRRYIKPTGNVFYSGELSVNRYVDVDRPEIHVTPGLGYGRFIHVTPLARAVRIEEFLLKEGLIKGPLSKETLVALAQVIDRENEFQTNYGDRYKVRWFEAMEKVISESGMFVHEGFGGVGTMRVYEVLFEERVNQRFTGWWVRTGVEFQALTPYPEESRDDPGLSLRLRYSRPVGWKSQFGINAEYTSPVTGDFGYDVFELRISFDYLYEVTNRIDFTLSNNVTAVRRDPRIKTNVYDFAQAGFIFYIENQINLSINGQFSKRRGRESSHGLKMAIEYRLR